MSDQPRDEASSGRNPPAAEASQGGQGGGGGMSTGLKLFLGCLGVAALGLVILAVTVGVGGFALKRGVESTFGSVGEHREASETLARLGREHPFEVPADGVVSEERLRRFVAVTDRAWREMEPWAEEISELRARTESRENPRLRDAVAGARAVGGMARSRLALAEALEAEDVSLGEYAWTGLTLARAAEARRRGSSTSDVPPENLRLIERHEEALPDFGSAEPGPASVLAVATVWGMTEAPTWEALGLDTLAR